MSSNTMKGNRNLRKNSKKSSRKSSRRSHKNTEERDQYEQKYTVPQQQQQSYMNELQNPYNLEFDPLHVNYITPSFKNLNLNNYGVSADQLSMGPQSNSMYNASMKDFSMMPQQMPQMQQMQQQMMPQMSQPMMMQEQMQQPMMMGNQSLEQMTSNNDQSGGGKYIYKRYLRKI